MVDVVDVVVGAVMDVTLMVTVNHEIYTVNKPHRFLFMISCELRAAILSSDDVDEDNNGAGCTTASMGDWVNGSKSGWGGIEVKVCVDSMGGTASANIGSSMQRVAGPTR